jgi:transposase
MSELRRFGTELSANRVANGEWTPEARTDMIGAADAGVSLSKIAEAVGASQRGVVSRVISRTKARGTSKTANRRRGKYKTTARDEHHLVVLARRFPEDTYGQLIRRAGLSISSKTCKRILHRYHLNNWRKAKRILSTEEDAQHRLEFARYWSHSGRIQQLLEGLFSDECTIQNSPDKPGQWVFRYASERFRQDLVDTASHGRPPISIMVWGMVWQRDGEGCASKLVFCKGDPEATRGGVSSRSYCDVLDEGLCPYYEPGDMFI